MIGIDTNILIDLMVSSSPTHIQAKEKIKRLIEEDFCTTPTNIGEVLRLLTHPKVFSFPLNITKAVNLLTMLLESYNIKILEEPLDWWETLPKIEKEIPGIRANEIFDARIALCLRVNGVKKIFTRDADFRKFSFLKINTFHE